MCQNYEHWLNSVILESMLRDRLVVEIDNKAIQCQLLSEITLTFKKVLECA